MVLSGIAVLTLNLWTGGPMLALWIGSRAQGSGPTKTTTVAVVVAVLAAISWAILRALAALNAVYERLTCRPRGRHRTAWLRSVRDERADAEAGGGASAAEVVMVAIVLVAIALLEIWFFFYSGSPIDQRSGR
jgi:hypothetical protein